MQEIGVGIVGWGFMDCLHAHVLREIRYSTPAAGSNPSSNRFVRGVLKSRGTRRNCWARPTSRTITMNCSPGRISRCSTSAPNALHEEMIVDALRASLLYLGSWPWTARPPPGLRKPPGPP